MNKTPTRLLLADEHVIVRQGLSALLSSVPDLKVVGEAGDGWNAVQLTRTYRPDLVVMDVSLPKMNGIDAAREIRERGLGAKILILTANRSDECIRQALRAGVCGYALKGGGMAELLLAIRSISDGHAFLSPSISASVINGYVNGQDCFDASQAWTALTKRERQVLQLIGEGHRNRDAAQQLNISIKTVEKHRFNLKRKLNIGTVHELVRFWQTQSVTSAPNSGPR